MLTRRTCHLLIVVSTVFCVGIPGVAKTKKRELSFSKDILPIFRAKCIRCHAGVEPKAGLNLTSPSSLLVGGKSGAALRIRAAEFSLLYEKVSSGKMPPVGQKLTAEEKGLIRTWINEGAAGVSNAATVDRSEDITGLELWSFQPPVRPDVPKVAGDAVGRVRNPIDRFVIARLQTEGLDLASEASRLTLLRRASFDLLGLPPSEQQISQFVSDDSPSAYESLIERLLSNPAYGERWARHWLDVAGFAESAGILSEDRGLPLAWRYRDYVIRAFNKDKPYDRFLQEQIAGDELTGYWSEFESAEQLSDEVVEGIIATGFLRTASDPSRPDFKTIKNAAAQYYYPTLFDTLQIVSSSTMGLTMQCARCHSHKFDPIPQVDYYKMQAVFMTAYRPENWVPQMNRRLHIASKKQKDMAAKKNAEVDANLKKLKDELAKTKSKFTSQVYENLLGTVPEEIRSDVKNSLDKKDSERSEVEKYLAKKFQKKLRPAGKELEAILKKNQDFTKLEAELNRKIAAEDRRHWYFDEVRALYDLPGEVTTPVLLRGDPLTPGPTVEPGALSTLKTPEPFHWTQPQVGAKSSGRRLAFARWLTQPKHPLTARVMVNRIWMHHFGRGLVATPDDFGVSGAPPSHPLLLDWLATEFVRSGWSVKHIHRLIMNSATWRQRWRVLSADVVKAKQIDAGNDLLWRQRMRRLEAEPLRDAVLFASGTLKQSMYGNSHAVARQGSGEVVVNDTKGRKRRSVYVKILRLNPQTMLEVFDQPTISVNCTQRTTSTVSTQALTMLNSDAMVQAANAFATSLANEPEDEQIRKAVLRSFAREPASDERKLFAAFIEEVEQRYLADSAKTDQADSTRIKAARLRALAELCHMLLSANEFAYVD